MSVTRPLTLADAPALAALQRADADHLGPWQPRRPTLSTVDGQLASISALLDEHAAGRAAPFVIVDDDRVVGSITLATVIRGAFQSCSVGYALAADAQGRGLATAALREAVAHAFDDLRLHRVQAETLVHNERSRRVLDRVGFVQYGEAPDYLCIDGQWQTCALYQLLTPTPDRVRPV